MNPYASPAVVELTPKRELHLWNGRAITVECFAIPQNLWLDPIFEIRIDGMMCYRQRPFGFNDTVCFSFEHDDGQQWCRVSRAHNFQTRNMKYRLFINGELLGEGETPIHHWYLGVLVVLLLAAMIISFLGLL